MTNVGWIDHSCCLMVIIVIRRWMDGWMDGYIDGYMGGLIDCWIDVWMFYVTIITYHHITYHHITCHSTVHPHLHHGGSERSRAVPQVHP